MTSKRAMWIVVAAALGMAGCARPATPEGGYVPDTPLTVVETRPEANAVVPPFGGSVVIEFARRVSERLTGGSLQDAVVVSPHLGDVEVETHRRGIEISMEGGFQERTMYRIMVLPRFRDLYQNSMAEPFDLVFSTGDALEPNLLAGLVTDRLTLEVVEGARVDVIPTEDGFTHATVTDSDGIFTFPHLPAGGYALVAYNDQDRNREAGFQEPQDSLAVNLELGDTLIVTDPALLAPDTTAAVVQDAVAVDTLTVRVTFDDYLDPEASLEDVVATVLRDGLDAPEVLEILHVHEWEGLAPAPDVPDPDPQPDDPAAPPADPALPPADADPPPAPDSPSGPPLPAQAIVLILSESLEADAPYRVEVEDVTNINGVPGGGGEADFEGPLEPEPEPDPDALDPDADPTDPDADPPDPDPADPPDPDPADPPPPP